ncbi:hypothetical protein QJS04_geneDACA006287 [Acorus gramineus]|uniref:Uncharacterized protein n=1 Tax=Acorus gramineus TaxID=55184 RepID=A0AAV9AWF8_ACOGR|nr:hypothetical protein QJS04_geneDACA006287 [Acorus gramineus]
MMGSSRCSISKREGRSPCVAQKTCSPPSDRDRMLRFLDFSCLSLSFLFMWSVLVDDDMQSMCFGNGMSYVLSKLILNKEG